MSMACASSSTRVDNSYRATRRRAQRLQAHARTIQGLRGHPARSTAISRCTPRCSARTRVPIEVQIRTRRHGPHRRVRHRGALEVQGRRAARARRSRSARASGSRTWCEMEVGGNSEEFIESVKVDLFPDKVYVFTPRGEILRLPRGATVVDFAYAVHTDIGNRCVAAKIDRRLTPLRAVLRNGQTVHDHDRQGRKPRIRPGSISWSPPRRAPRIRHYLKGLQRQRGGGARTAAARARRWRSSTSTLEKVPTRDRSQSALARVRRSTDPDELYEKIGLGERLAPLVARRLLPASIRRSTPATAQPPRHSGRGRHRRAAGQLRALLLPHAQRSDLRFPEHRARHRRASRDLRQRRPITASTRRSGCRSTWQSSKPGRLFLAEIRVDSRQPHGHCWRRCPRPYAGTQTNVNAA